jgi:Tol biopolymer transport system component
MQARWSPDGKWFAYTSDEPGSREVYVQPYPPTGGKWQISTDGGSEPQWRADASELFYVSRDRKLMSVAVTAGETFEWGVLRPIGDIGTPIVTAPFGSSYAVAPDGQRFLVNAVLREATATPIAVVLNWPAAILR